MKSVIAIFFTLLTAAIVFAGNHLFKSIEPEISAAINLVGNTSLEDVEDTTIFYSSNAEKIAEFSGNRRYKIKISALKKSTIQAFLAIEDADFFEHSGISITAIIRAAWANIVANKTIQGASTITQQVARTFFLSREKTIERKLREIMFAMILEQKFSKLEILELYLNKIYFGNGAYGIEAAAQTFFRKSAAALNIHEAALLAALPKAPSKLNPIKNRKLAEKRQKIVLKRMYEENYLTSLEYKKYRSAKLQIIKSRPKKMLHAPYFVKSSVKVLRKFLDQTALKSGLRVYTTLNLRVQKLLEKSLARGNHFLLKKYLGDKKKFVKEMNYAGVSVDVENGKVLALAGGKDFQQSQYNRALFTKREMGNLMIPILSVLNLERGHKLYDIAVGKNLTYYDLLKRKDIYGLASLSSRFGFGSTHLMIRKAGLKIKRNDMSLLLGQEKLSIFELAHLFATLPMEGMQSSRFNFIESVLNPSGKEILKLKNKIVGKRVFSRNSANLVNAVLKDSKCVYRYVDSKGKSDNYYVVEYNDKYLNFMWFGSERGKVIMPKLNRQEEISFGKLVSSLNSMPCHMRKSNNISYYRMGYQQNKRWIPFISSRTKKNKKEKL